MTPGSLAVLTALALRLLGALVSLPAAASRVCCVCRRFCPAAAVRISQMSHRLQRCWYPLPFLCKNKSVGGACVWNGGPEAHSLARLLASPVPVALRLGMVCAAGLAVAAAAASGPGGGRSRSSQVQDPEMVPFEVSVPGLDALLLHWGSLYKKSRGCRSWRRPSAGPWGPSWTAVCVAADLVTDGARSLRACEYRDPLAGSEDSF